MQTQKEKLQSSLNDVIHDLAITEKQLKESCICPISNLEVSRVYAARDYMLYNQLHDLKLAKCDLERQIKELED